jgi:hypothetical protein
MKSFAFAVITALSLFQSSFAAPAVKARDCASIPSTADPAIRDQVYRITQSRGVTAKVLLSTFEVSQVPMLFLSTCIANVYCFRPPGSSPMSTTCEQEPITIISYKHSLTFVSGLAVTKTLLESSSSALAKAGAAMIRS